jgi:2-polyprenyl-3-methyl-5-hydroxy-6-metoxy-1,4-benzoquinol methylase
MSSFDPAEKIRVLDFACGRGRYSLLLSIDGADVMSNLQLEI